MQVEGLQRAARTEQELEQQATLQHTCPVKGGRAWNAPLGPRADQKETGWSLLREIQWCQTLK